MTAIVRLAVVPVIIVLAVMLGGSAQSIWGVLILQLLAILTIGWAVVAPADALSQPGKPLLLLIIAALVIIGLQLIPLPPAIWTQLPGRDVVVHGYGVLVQRLPWLPLSLTPYETLETFLFLLVPSSVVVAVLRLGAYRDSWVAGALFGTTLVAIVLGYLQVSTGRQSGWYLYEQTNLGSAVGFFANRNHMGTLLLMTLPFVSALFFAQQAKDRRHATAPVILGGVGVLVILLGVAINGSLAAVAFAVPVIAASAILIPALGRFRTLALSASAVGLVGALIVLADSPVQPKVTGETVASFEGRQQIWATSVDLIERAFPVGTGFGSFERVYPLAEAPRDITRTYVNHAHNDYLQLVVEGGLAAIVLLLLFLAWWTRRAIQIFSAPAANRFAAAAVIASGAVLAHSLVDYPLRTTAIAAIFAFCLGAMARAGSVGVTSGEPASKRTSARHEVIG